MNLGEKLRLARQEAGISQRQLCGEVITRNMLSQIENGSANPSVATLQYLASRLSKPMSYFLEEDAVVSSNHQTIAAARAAFDRKDYESAEEALKAYRAPDSVYDREKELLSACIRLNLAEQALADGKQQYAKALLEKASAVTPAYMAEALTARGLLLRGQLEPQNLSAICEALPSMDAELLLRSRNALNCGNPMRAAQLLDAAEDQTTLQWNLLRGEIHETGGDYPAAIACFQKAEEAFPTECGRHLERCFREIGDFKMAYYYACKLRERTE